jgi:hypothetical protein
MTTKKTRAPKAKAAVAPPIPENEPEILLPRTPEALDELVQIITAKFDLPPGDETYEAVATMIMHIPAQRAYAPLAYFGNGVLKSMANAAAYQRLGEIAKRRAERKKAEQENLSAPTTPASDSPEPVDELPL